MSITQLPITPELVDYLDKTLHFDERLEKLITETKAHPRAMMLTHPTQIQFITILLKAMSARNVIEVGVFTGCTTLAIAQVLPEDGQIIACDIDDETMQIGRPYWEAANVSQRIIPMLGPALDTLNKLVSEGRAGTFDAIYIDANKKQYPDYYEVSLSLLRKGGLLLLDNLLQGGRVADNTITDETVTVMRQLTKRLSEDDRIDFSLLTLGDGLGVAYKR